jgi:hypothetical protein
MSRGQCKSELARRSPTIRFRSRFCERASLGQSTGLLSGLRGRRRHMPRWSATWPFSLLRATAAVFSARCSLTIASIGCKKLLRRPRRSAQLPPSRSANILLYLPVCTFWAWRPPKSPGFRFARLRQSLAPRLQAWANHQSLSAANRMGTARRLPLLQPSRKVDFIALAHLPWLVRRASRQRRHQGRGKGRAPNIRLLRRSANMANSQLQHGRSLTGQDGTSALKRPQGQVAHRGPSAGSG